MSYRYMLSRLYFIFMVAIHLHRANFDKVVLENHATLFLCIKLFGNYAKYRGKYIYHLHNALSGTYGCCNEIQDTAIVLGVSNYIIDQYKQDFPSYSSKTRFVVVRNWIDKGHFKALIDHDRVAHLKERMKIPDDAQVVLFAGRITREKGIDVLIRAWRQLNRPHAVLVITGSYYYKSGMQNNRLNSELQSLLKETTNVRFTGYLDYQDMPNVYALADLVVLPSMWEDSAPLTVIESLSLGVPLITTNSGGIPEYANRRNSIILDKNDPHFVTTLATAIANLLDDPAALGRMRSATLGQTKEWTADQYFHGFMAALES